MKGTQADQLQTENEDEDVTASEVAPMRTAQRHGTSSAFFTGPPTRKGSVVGRKVSSGTSSTGLA